MTTLRRRLAVVTAAVIGLGVLSAAAAAQAGPALITTRPVVDAETDQLTFFVGGFNDGGRSLKASSLDLLIDGQRSDSAPVIQSLSDWSTAAAEGSKDWRPPLSVAWCTCGSSHIPSGVLDGIQAFSSAFPRARWSTHRVRAHAAGARAADRRRREPTRRRAYIEG